MFDWARASAQPNVQPLLVLDRSHIAMYAMCDIDAGDELGFDYQVSHMTRKREQRSNRSGWLFSSHLCLLLAAFLQCAQYNVDKQEAGPTFVCHCEERNC